MAARKRDVKRLRRENEGRLDENRSRLGTQSRSPFVGPNGLRPGWACLLFLLLIFFYESAFSALARHLLHGRPRPSALPPGVMVPAEFLSAFGVLFATWLMSRAEGRPFTSFGLRDRALWSRFGGGLLTGFAAISALVGTLWAAHLLVLGGAGLALAATLRYGLLWAAAFLLTALFEEALLRGYLLWTLARGIGFPWSAALLSVGFGLVHGSNPGETPVGLFAAATVGLLFSLSIWYTGSLWWAIGFHAAWDWGESFFWGVSDSGLIVEGHLVNAHAVGARLWSGGATGPEGSLLVFPVLLLCAAGMAWRWHGRAAWGMRQSPRNAEPNLIP